MSLNFLQHQSGENNGIIYALQGIDDTHDSHDPICNYPSTINEGTYVDDFNNEDEVNSDILGANIPEINQ